MNRVNKIKSNIDKNVGTNRKSDNRAMEGNEDTAFDEVNNIGIYVLYLLCLKKMIRIVSIKKEKEMMILYKFSRQKFSSLIDKCS